MLAGKKKEILLFWSADITCDRDGVELRSHMDGVVAVYFRLASWEVGKIILSYVVGSVVGLDLFRLIGEGLQEVL